VEPLETPRSPPIFSRGGGREHCKNPNAAGQACGWMHETGVTSLDAGDPKAALEARDRGIRVGPCRLRVVPWPRSDQVEQEPGGPTEIGDPGVTPHSFPSLASAHRSWACS
jgi:hypothetical protein